MSGRTRVRIRQATASDAARIHGLITSALQDGRLLPRSLSDVTAHAERFVVAVRGRQLVGCAELSPLSPQVAEIRSLVVDTKARRLGIGSGLVDELRRQAQRGGFDRVCAFTHAPGWFGHLGFSLVPHRWVPEKIATDCVKCEGFRRCGQLAMVMALDTAGVAVGNDRMWSVRAL